MGHLPEAASISDLTCSAVITRPNIYAQRSNMAVFQSFAVRPQWS